MVDTSRDDDELITDTRVLIHCSGLVLLSLLGTSVRSVLLHLRLGEVHPLEVEVVKGLSPAARRRNVIRRWSQSASWRPGSW